ncbi:MAG: MarR family transcriptional regulator [Oscillospiraceae bacterium]|nr:MarR family transcriptional regulator [Oscillospiraceae bacterium]
MATIMRKMNVISRCEAIYRTQRSSEQLLGIYHSYVFAICKNPGASQDKLAKYLCINKSSVTRHLSALEKDGYVERRVSESDKRETLVYPTQKMLDILPEVVKITSDWNALVAEGISEEELALFNSIMDRMLEKSMKIIYSGDSAE